MVEAVILTYKPDEKLKSIVTRLQAQTVKPKRILIINTIDKSSSYTVVDKIRNYETVTVIDIRKEEFDHGATRDKAMQLCGKSDYVLMMTQDAVPKSRYLIENLVKALEKDKYNNAVAYAKQEADKDCNIIERYTRIFNYSDDPHSGMEMSAETNRKLYDEIGGFPLRAIFNEDMVFAGKSLKADKDVIYEPKAVVIHSHNYTGIEYFRRYFDLGVSHKEFSYILKEYHSQDEGIKLVMDTAKYLCRRGRYFMICPLIYYSACKFVGFNLGKRYKKLPDNIIKKCSLNKGYWNKNK